MKELGDGGVAVGAVCGLVREVYEAEQKEEGGGWEKEYGLSPSTSYPNFCPRC